MDALAGLLSGLVGLVVVIFLVVLAILWVILPFAVFGIKDRLDAIIHELKRLNKV